MKLLIADDDKLTREGLESCINLEQFNIVRVPSAENGRIALSRIIEHNVDILITDIKMPFLSGFELIKAVNEQGFFPATIIISGYDNREYLQEAVKLNIVTGYIFKPVSLDQLRSTLEETVAFRRKWLENVVMPKIQPASSIRYSYHNYIVEIQAVETIHKHLNSGDLQAGQTAFSLLWNQFQSKGKSLNYVKRFCWECIISFLQMTTKAGVAVDTFFYATDPLAEITTFQDVTQMKSYMESFIENIYLCLQKYHLSHNAYADYLSQAILTRYNERDLSVQNLAIELGVTANYLSTLYKKRHTNTFSSDLISTRITMAKQLLCTSNLKIAQIAQNVGFHDPKYFTTVFKELTGVTPKYFRSRMVMTPK